jgi:hypothetical protein
MKVSDAAKVRELLDSGWTVRIWKNGFGDYTAQATSIAGKQGRMTGRSPDIALVCLARNVLEQTEAKQ